MTITPTFHFACHHCGKAFDLTGETARFDNYSHRSLGLWLECVEEALIEAAKCLDDTCKDCMSIVYEAHAKEREFQAEKDLS